jgi:hypothetical protein
VNIAGSDVHGKRVVGEDLLLSCFGRVRTEMGNEDQRKIGRCVKKYFHPLVCLGGFQSKCPWTAGGVAAYWRRTPDGGTMPVCNY